MTEARWLNGPVGLDAHNRVLRQGCRTVLVVVPYVVAGTRLADVLALLEADHRVTVVFTVAPMPNETLCHGAEQFVQAQGGFVLPWHQAVQCEFDLILAASETSVAQLHGKVLLLPHGAGAVGSRLHARSAGPQACTFHGLDRGALIWRGRLVPAALPLTHDAELAVLRTSCPEALPVSTVAGDICFDRLVASLPWRESYRAALGLREGQKLVTVTSTWQPESALGRHPDLLDRLAAELPTQKYRLAAILHPNIWAVHGAWQVRAWLANCLRAGLLLLPPEEGWRAALIASDVVIGDYGSVTSYAAAIGAPVLRASSLPEDNMRDDSLAASVARLTPQLRLDWSLTGQLRAVTESHGTGPQAAISDLITSRPGQAGTILRRMMYGLLKLPEPARQVVVRPVPLPGPASGPTNLCPGEEI